jgi:hypothetical protein
MKKTLLLLLSILFCSPVFPVSTEPSKIDVSTVVQGINRMKITASPFSGNPAQFENAPVYTGPLEITAPGEQDFSAYLSIISNNHNGYTVSMSATSMTYAVTGQASAYIDYTVTVNGQSIITNEATSVAPVDVITVPTMSGLGSQSHKIYINVNQADFASAVEGTYTGMVTFQYTSNI